MALPLNREWPNRGGKPLVSLGINGVVAAFLLTLAGASKVRSKAAHQELRSNQSVRDFPMRG